MEIPDLALQAVLRDRPGLGDAPVAVVVRRAGREWVAAASAAARVQGVGPGGTAAAARALVPELQLFPADAARARGHLDRLAEALQAFSPAVEPARPDALLLDASVAAELPRLPADEGPPGPDGGLAAAEEAWAEAVLACVEECGWTGRVAVADTPLAARVLAAALPEGRRVRSVPAGRRGVALGPVPLALVLRLADEAREAAGAEALLPSISPAARELLDQLGVRTLGRLQELPGTALVERLGLEAAHLLGLARGGEPRPLVPFRAEAPLVEHLDLEWAVEDAQALLFALKTLADRLSARLVGRGRAAARLRLALAARPEFAPDEAPDGEAATGEAEGGATSRNPDGIDTGALRGGVEATLGLARPAAQAKVLLDLLRERLDALTLPGPVSALTLEVLETAKLGEQLSLGENAQVREALDSVLARLSSRLGPAAVGSPVVRPHCVPERAGGLVPFRPAPVLPADPALREVSPERERAPPEPAAGGARASGEGEPPGWSEDLPPRPVRLTGPEPVEPEFEPGGAFAALRQGGLRQRVVDWTLPERLSTGWWEEPAVRDYYTLLLADGSRVWVFRDRADRWWLHGVFD